MKSYGRENVYFIFVINYTLVLLKKKISSYENDISLHIFS